MHSPIPHDLTKFGDKFEFEKNGFCPHQWEISVPQKNCIIWSVVLSHLRTADFTATGKFEERLNQLTDKLFDPEAVKLAVLGFNPFFNIHKCFFDRTLQEVCLSFKKLLNKSPSITPKTVREDLQIISTLLKSNILIVDLSNENLHLITPSSGYCTDAASITLVCREYLSKDIKQVVMKRFTFSLNKDLCWELRREAFEIILESTEIMGIAEKEIHPLTEKKEKRVNILITLLRKDLSHEICELYDSPYTVAKLADAGFETNPMVLDMNGLSAFYYALLSNDRNIIYLLHKYAANESDNTFRDPDSRVLANLFQLHAIILNDRFKSNNFQYSGDKMEQARLGSGQLQLYNDFLIKTCKVIQDNQKSKDNSAQEASRQKAIILHILEVYDEYFSFGQLDTSLTESELLENYTKHKVYYDNLDSIVSLLFFDNIFLLKGMFLLEKDVFQSRSYFELESRFVLSIMTNKYFGANIQDMAHKYNNATSTQSKSLGSDSGNLYIFSLAERHRLRESVRMFCRILKEKELIEEDSVECISKRDISDILRDFPEIKDELLISRLRYYLNSAVESEPEDFKHKFVIQRALQVVGESLEVATENPSFIKFLLRSCISSETISMLTQLKNKLSHIEQDDDLFKSIQFDILNIKEAFEEVFDIQKVRFLEFLINRGLESVQKCQQPADITMFSDHHPLVRPLEKLEETMRKRKSEFLIFCLDIYLKTAIETVSFSLTRNFKIHRALKMIDEFMNIQKEYPSSIRHFVRSDLSDDILKILKKARNTLSYLESSQFLENFETDKDDSLFRSIQSEIRNIKNALEEAFDTQNAWLMKFLLNRGLESVRKFQRHGGFEACSDDRKAVQKGSSGFECISDHKGRCVSVPSIIKLSRKLKGFASRSEEELIRGEIPPEVKDRADDTKKLEQELEGGIIVDSERFDSLFLQRKDLCSIKKDYEKYLEEESEPSKSSKSSSLLHKIRNAPNPLNILDLIFEKKKVSNSQLKFLHENIFFSDKVKNTLNSLIEKSELPCDGNLVNLLNRIKHLQQISIDEQYNIRYLWERAKSPKAKEFLIYKIVQLYLRDSSFQASLEMLLFDCAAIIKNNEDFKPFWLKTSYLFNGIDVRNVLAHGDPLVESVRPILDPTVFPSELVKKMLQLFEDRECIEALCDLQRKLKQWGKIPENCPECQKLKERIVLCGRWQGYCKLLAEDAKDVETCDSIVSFLEKTFETKRKKLNNVMNSKPSRN